MAVVADAGAEGSLKQAPHYPSMRKKSTIFSYLASISLGRNISVILLLLVLRLPLGGIDKDIQRGRGLSDGKDHG